MDWTRWADLLSDPAVGVATLFSALAVGLGVGVVALAITLVYRHR
jgi:hypothetical protein